MLLPIDNKIPLILETLKKNKNLILTAAPGAGKTTRLPPALLKLTDKKILVLEPRRVAALAAASRIAEENKWTLGKEVGYQVRFQNESSKSTPLIFLTEALLSRKMLNDPELNDIGIVVLDEFHERSIHTDLAIGLLKELQELSRPDLKIVVMSATMNAKQVSNYLGEAPVVEVPGLLYELKTHYQKNNQLLNLSFDFIQKVAKQIKEVANQTKNDILVFLPGLGEIERTKTLLELWAHENKILLLPLHGGLSLNEQKIVLESSPQRKIILATNIAESAITIDGVAVVIDSGLAKTMRFNSATGLPSLETGRISRASATQRAGRAARQGPGQVFRMWNKQDELSMPDFEIAEIQRIDLSEVCLFLARQGITDFMSFSWYEAPDPKRIKIAESQLRSWEALNINNQITEIGKKMATYPLPPRLARLLLEGEVLHISEFASEICALLSERLPSEAADLLSIWENFNSRRNENRNRHILKTSEQLKKITGATKSQDFDKSEPLQKLLLSAFADRICRRRRTGEATAQMIDGSGVRLPDTVIKNDQDFEFFIAIELIQNQTSADAQLRTYLPIQKSLLEAKYKNQIKYEEKIIFDEKSQKLLKIQSKKIFALQIEDPKTQNATAEEASAHLPEITLSRWEELLRLNQELADWVVRYNWYCQQMKSPQIFPDVTLRALEQACFNEHGFKVVAEKNLVSFFEMQLPTSELLDFKNQCPEVLEVPSGSRLRLHYFPDKNPVLEVRLQEIFGWAQTPKIFNKKTPITLHLLAPNYRPVQVTQDLESFWKNGYVEVKKELRSRYPKHSWPDDPLTAKPEAKGKRRQN